MSVHLFSKIKKYLTIKKQIRYMLVFSQELISTKIYLNIINNFEQMPLTKSTKLILNQNNFVRMTSIQRLSLPYLLAGSSILINSKPGTGKTLLIMIPILESISKDFLISIYNSLTLIFSPTFELCLQSMLVYKTLVSGSNIFKRSILLINEDLEKKNLSKYVVFSLSNKYKSIKIPENIYIKVLVYDEFDIFLDHNSNHKIEGFYDKFHNCKQNIFTCSTLLKPIKTKILRISQIYSNLIAISLKTENIVSVNICKYYVTYSPSELVWFIVVLVLNIIEGNIIVIMQFSYQAFVLEQCFTRLLLDKPLFRLTKKMNFKNKIYNINSFIASHNSILILDDTSYHGIDLWHAKWLLVHFNLFSKFCFLKQIGRLSRLNNYGICISFIRNENVKEFYDLFKKNKMLSKKLKIKKKIISYFSSFYNFILKSIKLPNCNKSSAFKNLFKMYYAFYKRKIKKYDFVDLFDSLLI
mmetsp:Transcript_27691/g.44611  ORF Transcript_27691/g.44611 Transcript_27691/m.44611 type:complete len:469 (+) Transcript_27691:3825-5231(+)